MFLRIRTLNISNEAYARRTKGCRIVVSGCTIMMVQGRRGEPCRDGVIDMRESIIILIGSWRSFGEFFESFPFRISTSYCSNLKCSDKSHSVYRPNPLFVLPLVHHVPETRPPAPLGELPLMISNEPLNFRCTSPTPQPRYRLRS
jgi:hypothetical protein